MKRILLIGLVLVAGLSSVFAADYYISSYDVKITVGNNAVHHIVETIDVYFEGSHHGIVREIPLDYTDYNGKTKARVTNLKISDNYSSETDNGYLVIQIGSSSKTYTRQSVHYVIEYDYDLGADFNEDYDEFYMNIIGVDWECPIRKATFSITIPFVASMSMRSSDDFFDYVCENTYLSSGTYGSTSGDTDAYAYKADDGSVLIEGTTLNLNSYEGVTIRMDLPEGWYRNARMPWDYRGLFKVAGIVAAIALVVLAVVLWTIFGKDKTPIIVARFYPPKDFSPLLVGYVADSNVDDKDVISMLFYWADEGLLSIEEKKNNKYEFTKLKDIEAYAIESGKSIPELEVKLFNGFFKNRAVGDVVKFSDLEKNNFFQTIVETKLKTGKYFTKERALNDSKSRKVAGILALLSFLPLLFYSLSFGLYENADIIVYFHLGVCFLLFMLNLVIFGSLFSKWYMRDSKVFACILRIIPSAVAGFILYVMEMDLNVYCNIGLLVLAVVSSAVIALFAIITERRSSYGDEVLEEILGYREFIDKVEISKLKMMIKSDPDLYYRVLCYAVVLGLEDKWAKKFSGMMVQPPSWYSGYSAFDVYYMTRLATRMATSIPAASIPRSSISGSPGSRVGGGGFHSSGFSGGGFGGGGGHAW